MKEAGRIVSIKEKGKCQIRRLLLKGRMLMGNSMGLEPMSIRMELSTQGCGRIISSMGKGIRFLKMELAIRVNTSKEQNTGKVSSTKFF
jgi:hypothetical protein